MSSIDWRRYLDINEVARYADSHYRELQIAIYVVGATGIVVVARSLRLFTKFTTVHKIPDSYFRKQVKLNGFVRAIESEKSTVSVEHIPIVELSYHKGVKTLLPVRLAGLSSWCEPAASKFMASQVLGKRITFQLIEEGPKEEYLLAAVSHRPYWFWFTRSLNVDMVEKGLASYVFEGLPSSDVKLAADSKEASKIFKPQPVHHRLAEKLMQAQRTAQKKRVGIWSEVPIAAETSETALVPTTKTSSPLLNATAAVGRAIRYSASAIVFFPARIKDKILQKRSIS